MQVQSLGEEDPLEEEMATYSSILAWEITWAEEPMGSRKSQTRTSSLLLRSERFCYVSFLPAWI